jgi:chromosome partitioning protein
MKQIAISCLKGGVGKSTISINLAHAFKDFVNVAILDTDTQKTTDSLAGDYLTIYKKSESIGDHDILIVDTPPYIDSSLEQTFLNSDLILIPTRPSFADMDALQVTINLLKKVQKKKPELKAAIIINMEDSRSVLSQSILPALEQFGIPIFKTMIENRTNYVRSIISEDGIYSFKDKKAVDEFNSFVKEVYSFLI